MTARAVVLVLCLALAAGLALPTIAQARRCTYHRWPLMWTADRHCHLSRWPLMWTRVR